MNIMIKTTCNEAVETDMKKIHKDDNGLFCECPYNSGGCGGTCDCEIITPRYLYHCTDISKKNDISNNGLSIEEVKAKNNGNVIYLSLSPEYCYGNTCFKVDVIGLNVQQTNNIWEYICSDNIASDRVEYYGYKEIE